jgi:flagellar hook protein FlgE
MSIAFSNALSGLNANATAIDVVSGNLANLNTTGYKNVQVSFEDLVNQTLDGISSSSLAGASTVAQTNQQFTQGTLQTTGGAFDAAIQGGGFFVLKNANGQQVFSRQGNFKVSDSGQLLTAAGQSVQGWNAVGGVLNTGGAPANIALPVGLSVPPSATTAFTLSVNLNSNATVDSPNATFSSPVQVIDAQGNAHAVTITYKESAANTWDYTVTMPSTDLLGGSGADATLASGTLTFDGKGILTDPGAADGKISIPIQGLANGAADLNVTWNLYDASGNPTITQNTQASANLASSQDGVQAGQLRSLNVGPNGEVIAHFSNGTTQSVAQIALASILNPDSMQPLDGNSYAPTAATATPVIGMPSTGARGKITGGTLETSTVDIATEFTNLLQFERGYQANSKVITTEDEIIQETVGLKR